MKNLLDFINCYDNMITQPQTVSVERLNCYTLLTEVIPKVNSSSKEQIDFSIRFCG
ncbi:hypothetical protein IJ674_09645 [bacterium]|nr:hypothetical protein [bacterium]